MVCKGHGLVGFFSFSMCTCYTEIPNISAFDNFQKLVKSYKLFPIDYDFFPNTYVFK